MKKELILAIHEANNILHASQKSLNKQGIKFVKVPEKWFYDDLNESLDELELLEYLYSKWVHFRNELHGFTAHANWLFDEGNVYTDRTIGLGYSIIENSIPIKYNTPCYLIESVYHLEEKTGIFTVSQFENIYNGEITLEEFTFVLLGSKDRI